MPKKEPKYIIYAPLASTRVSPATVLLFANARQSPAITEAVQQVEPGVLDALLRIQVQVRGNFILEFLFLTCPSQKHF